jgi:hypothetical protein
VAVKRLAGEDVLGEAAEDLNLTLEDLDRVGNFWRSQVESALVRGRVLRTPCWSRAAGHRPACALPRSLLLRSSDKEVLTRQVGADGVTHAFTVRRRNVVVNRHVATRWTGFARVHVVAIPRPSPNTCDGSTRMTVRRDIEVPSPTATSSSPGRKVIAAIGIDRYDHWQRLANAVRDATRIAELFNGLGFEQLTTPLLDRDATGEAIRSLATVELKKLGANDSLVLFYAGHGATYGHRPGGEEIRTGYLIPSDASSDPEDVSTWIDLDGWLRAVSLLPAKHILVILDACRSGIALDGIIQRHRGDDAWRRETSAALQARRSRRIITSALADQVALDSGPKHGHSLFTGCLIEGLTYDLQRRGERTITGSGLGAYLQRRVDAHTGSQQTPDFGTFFHDNRGEIAIPLVDRRPARARPARPAVAVAPAVDVNPISSGPGRRNSQEGAMDGARREQPSPSHPRSNQLHSSAPALGRREAQAQHAATDPTSESARAPLDARELSQLVERLKRAVAMQGQRMTVAAVATFFATTIATGLLGDARHDVFSTIVANVGFLATLGLVVLRVIKPIGMRRVVYAVRDAPERVVVLRRRATNTAATVRLRPMVVILAILLLTFLVLTLAVSWTTGLVLGALVAIPVLAVLRMRPALMKSVIDAARSESRLLIPFMVKPQIEIRASDHHLVIATAKDGEAMFHLLVRRCPTATIRWN